MIHHMRSACRRWLPLLVCPAIAGVGIACGKDTDPEPIPCERLTPADLPSVPERQLSIAPYAVRPTDSSAVILWETLDPEPGVLLWGTDDGEMTNIVCADPPGTILVDAEEFEEVHDGYLHRVELTGLAPGTRYRFTVPNALVPVPDPNDVFGGEIEYGSFSEGHFTTASDDEVGLVVYGDNQCIPYTHQTVMEALRTEQVELALHVGDIVHNGFITQYRENYFVIAWPFVSQVGHIYVSGNHEGVGESLPFDDFFDVAPGPEVEMPDGTTTLSGPRTYVHDYGPLRFFVLDTERDVDQDSLQYAWLEQQLQRATADVDGPRWLFVALHRPVYTGSEHGGDGPPEGFHDLMLRYGVNAVFTGHAHCYERFLQDDLTYVVTGGAGALLHRCDEEAVPGDYNQVACESVYHYALGHIRAETAEFEVIAAEDGDVIDLFTIDR